MDKEKQKKIAIVGTASSCVEAPFYDDSWEVWAVAGIYGKVPIDANIHRHFEIHKFDYLKRECGAKDEYFNYLKGLGNKLVICQKEKLAPDAKILRRDELIASFGSYWTSSVAWMIGEAILEGFDKIGLWGVHCQGTNEYESQRAGIEGYLRFIQGMGKEVYVHPKSSLFKAPIYGDDELTRISKGIKFAKERSMRMFDMAQYWKGYEDALVQYKAGSGDCENIKEGM